MRESESLYIYMGYGRSDEADRSCILLDVYSLSYTKFSMRREIAASALVFFDDYKYITYEYNIHRENVFSSS